MALVQRLGRPIAEDVQLCDLSKACDLAAFLYLVLDHVQGQLKLISNTDAVCFANRLAEDKVLVELLPQRQCLLIQTIQDIEAVQPLQGVDAQRLKGLGLKEHAEQEDVRAKHKCWVVDDFWDGECIPVRHSQQKPRRGTL